MSKNDMKDEGFLKVAEMFFFFEMDVKTFSKPKQIAKIRFLIVNFIRFTNVNNTFPQS